jgi:hypothetical protein
MGVGFLFPRLTVRSDALSSPVARRAIPSPFEIAAFASAGRQLRLGTAQRKSFEEVALFDQEQISRYLPFRPV